MRVIERTGMVCANLAAPGPTSLLRVAAAVPHGLLLAQHPQLDLPIVPKVSIGRHAPHKWLLNLEVRGCM